MNDSSLRAVSGEAAAKAKTAQDFYADLEKLNLAPLWDRYNAITPPEPKPRDPGIHYRWKDVLPAIERATREVSVEEAERRALMLVNPAFAPQIATTCGLYCSIQILMPGEIARAHRHTASAFRFVMEGNGADTIVSGVHCPMNEGDLILTPNWTWHEHTNPGRERVSWFDGLDVPILYFYNAWFSEHGPAPNFRPDAAAYPDEVMAHAGIVPDQGREVPPYSPMFRYAWPAVADMLSHMPAEDDGTKRLQYTHPINGGPVMPTMDLYVQEIGKAETQPYRTTSNAIAVVVEGEGTTRFGDKTYDWGPHDIFTLPHWTWITHKASTPRARLFLSTDRTLLKRLDLLRDEKK